MLSLQAGAERSARAVIAAAVVLLAVLVAPAVATAAVTTTAVAGPATQPVHGQTAALTATVTNATTPSTVPTGSVQFSVDGAPLGAPVALSASGSAQSTTSALSAGSHPVRADYLPTGDFVKSDGTTTVTVGRANTTTVLRITPSTTGVAGQALAVEAVAAPTTPALGAPTGQVSFFVAGQKLGDATLDDGIARGAIALPAISITITVAYQGDDHYAGSSGVTTVTVNKAGTMIALSASPNPALVNQAVTFSMLVDSLAPSMWWPSGALSATVDGQPVPGTLTLDGTGGTGTFVRTFSAAGAHHVVAHFAGDDDFLASDAALDVTVNALPTPLPSPATPVAARGLSLKVLPKRDRRAPYRFTVSGSLQLPNGVTTAAGCTGKVNVDAKLKGKRVARKAAAVNRACRFATTVTVPRKGSASITATFGGNARIATISARAVKVRAG